jgi:hypothetical protein
MIFSMQSDLMYSREHCNKQFTHDCGRRTNSVQYRGRRLNRFLRGELRSLLWRTIVQNIALASCRYPVCSFFFSVGPIISILTGIVLLHGLQPTCPRECEARVQQECMLVITLTPINRWDAAVRSLNGEVMVGSICVCNPSRVRCPWDCIWSVHSPSPTFWEWRWLHNRIAQYFMCSEMTSRLRCEVSCLNLSRLSQSDTPASNGQLRRTLVWCKASERPRQAAASAMTFGRDHGGCSSKRESLLTAGICGDEAVGSAAGCTSRRFEKMSTSARGMFHARGPLPDRLPTGGRDAKSASGAVEGASTFSF